MLHSILIYFAFIAYWASVGFANTCVWSEKSEALKFQSPEIFWINMDKSVDRRHSLSNHLDHIGWLHRRIKGLSLDDIYIPSDVRSLWDQYDAKVQTSEVLLDSNDPKFVTQYGNASHFLLGLVGRGKSNRLKELGCTISHLEAMRQAIYNNRSSSKYAVITEDDIYIPFDINFQKLAEAAPPDFGILQLFNSNEESMVSVWKMYRRNQEQNTWVPNRVGQAASFWSTCAYLINREILRPIIDKVIYQVKQAVHVRIIAGIRKPCRPKLSYCCRNIPGTYSYEFIEHPPCFIAPKGFQADSFLYTLNRTYVLTTPLITNGAGGNQSTFHQDHVESIHQSAFRQQRALINDMINDVVPLPPFVNKGCTSSLPLQMELKKNNTCWYSSPDRRSVSIFWLYMTDVSSKEQFGDYVRNVVGREGKWLPSLAEASMYIPSDLSNRWMTRQCLIQTNEKRLQYRSVTPEAAKELNSIMKEGYQVAFSGLCGYSRHHHNGIRELAATVSHLLTLYHAKKQPMTETRFAIISSGEVFLALNPRFEALVASAPDKFGFLTFMVDDDDLVDRLWQEYIQNPTEKLWSTINDKYIDKISSQFYIVNLEVVGPILDAIVQLDINGDNGRTLSVLRLIAGGQHHPRQSRMGHHKGRSESDSVNSKSTMSVTPTDPLSSIDQTIKNGGASGCYPSECCSNDQLDRRPSYCLLSHGGSHKVEAVLWKMAPTYTLHIPIVLRGTYKPGDGYFPSRSLPLNYTAEGAVDASSITIDKKSRKSRLDPSSSDGLLEVQRQKQILNSVQSGQVPLPSFLVSSCSFKF